MTHQNWSQADDRLRGALQDVGLEVIFKAGRLDAEYSARLLGWVNPLEVKHQVPDEDASQRTHPTYSPLQEQWEKQVQAIQYLPTGHAYVRMPPDAVYKVHIHRLPELPAALPGLAAVQARYLDRYFTPAPGTGRATSVASPPPSATRTGVPDAPVIGRGPLTPPTASNPPHVPQTLSAGCRGDPDRSVKDRSDPT